VNAYPSALSAYTYSYSLVTTNPASGILGTGMWTPGQRTTLLIQPRSLITTHLSLAMTLFEWAMGNHLKFKI